MYTTPRENFIRLMNRNNGASSISVESMDRQIKVFADCLTFSSPPLETPVAAAG
ncbi:MAG: hypothetical protein NTX61_04460 [Bacteroidetes bacterium]|nr:hypothetical protein [Bacteroidota bacterium]